MKNSKKLEWKKPAIIELDIADTKSGTIPHVHEGLIIDINGNTTGTLQGPS